MQLIAYLLIFRSTISEGPPLTADTLIVPMSCVVV
jgi:hypothetical protein